MKVFLALSTVVFCQTLFDSLTTLRLLLGCKKIALNHTNSIFFLKRMYFRLTKSRKFRRPPTSPSPTNTSSPSTRSSSGESNINWRQNSKTLHLPKARLLTLYHNTYRKEPGHSTSSVSSSRHHRHSHSGSSTDTGSSRENHENRSRHYRTTEGVREESEMVISPVEKPKHHHHHHHHRHKHRPREDSSSKSRY